MSKINFILTLTIQGEKLEDIDEGLVKAAGQRLMARMKVPPRLNGQTIIKNELKDVRTKAQKDADIRASREHQDRIAREKKEDEKKESKEQVEQEKTAPFRALESIFLHHGPAATKDCLARFGVTKLSDLNENQYESFVQYCNSILEGKNEQDKTTHQ